MANGSGSTTFSFTSTTDPLYVRVAGWMGGNTVSGVTFNGVSLTKLGSSTLSSGSDEASIWKLAAPASGAHNIVVTISGGTSQAGEIGACNVTGQDGTTPDGTFASAKSAAAGTSTGDVSIAGAATGDLVLACVAVGAATAVTPSDIGGAAAVEEWDLGSNGEESEGFKAADAVTSVKATFASNTWAIAAIPLKAGAGGGGGGAAAAPSQRTVRGVG